MIGLIDNFIKCENDNIKVYFFTFLFHTNIKIFKQILKFLKHFIKCSDKEM